MNERLMDIQERISSGFGSMASQLPEIIADPRAYPREAMLLAAIVALALLLLILAVIVVADVVTSAGQRRRLNVCCFKRGLRGNPNDRQVVTVGHHDAPIHDVYRQLRSENLNIVMLLIEEHMLFANVAPDPVEEKLQIGIVHTVQFFVVFQVLQSAGGGIIDQIR